MNDTTSMSPVFIVGAPRSGTTLLLYMLRSHPKLFFPDEESHFIIPMQKLASRYGGLFKREEVEMAIRDMHTLRPVFFRGYTQVREMSIEVLTDTIIATHPKSVADIISQVYATMATLSGKSRWGDKTPYYALHLPVLKEMFPAAKFINVIRDGRDVALSLIERKYDMDIYNFYSAAKYWERYVTAVETTRSLLAEDTLLNVRYEDLLNSPQTTLQTICHFLDEEYLPTLVEFDKPKTLDTNLLQKTRLIGKPLESANQGKWKTRMSPRQIDLFDRTVGVTLKRNGYESSSVNNPVPVAIRLLFRIHNIMLRQYNRLLRNPFPKHSKNFRKSLS